MATLVGDTEMPKAFEGTPREGLQEVEAEVEVESSPDIQPSFGASA